jgi:cation transport regulator ChaB
MKQQIEKKLEYYKKQYNAAIDRYMESNGRKDKESAIRCKERVKTYEEVLKLIP